MPSDLDVEESSEEEATPRTRKRKGKPRKAFTGSRKKRRVSTEKSVTAEDDAVAEGLWETTPPNVVPVIECAASFSTKLSEGSTPLDAFQLYFSEDVIGHITVQTNLYASQTGRSGWDPITPEELRAYFGMLILMSTNPTHHVHLYWSSDSLFNVEEISQVMTFKRFQKITNSLHLNDNTLIPARDAQDYDRCYKVRPLIRMMNQKFESEYQPSSHLAVDESMILFKGRSTLKQYMPMKPKIKRGFKVWCLADSDTGYLCRFQLYEGKSEDRPKNRTLGEHVVLSLSEGIVPPGSQIFLTTSSALQVCFSSYVTAAS